MKGILLAGGAGTRMAPMTSVICKQLLPIYDKPMIYYPLSVLMMAGIREILIISTPTDLPIIERQFGSGEQLGVTFSYLVQPKPEGIAQAMILAEAFLDGQPSCLVLGDNIFYSQDLMQVMTQAATLTQGALVFGCRVRDPERYGVLELDEAGNVKSIIEKPKNPPSPFAVAGLYFYDADAPALARSLKPSPRGELEITDLNNLYLAKKKLQVKLFGRGMAWLDTGTPDSLMSAAQFVQALQTRQGLAIASIEEVAYRKGWLSKEQLIKVADAYAKSAYGDYLRAIANEK